MSSINYTIHVIGAGHLGAALIQGLLLSGIPPQCIYMTEHSEKRRQLISEELGIQVHANEPVDITLLCIKPQQMHTLNIKEDYSTQVIISTLAGTEIATLKQTLSKWPIVRAMPNLAAFYQASMTAIYYEDKNKKIHSMVDVFFQRMGQVIWLEKEDDMHVATAMVGSGPAFFLELIKSIINIDPKAPIEPMLYGALESAMMLAKNSDGDIGAIIKAITSPKGTTEAGLKIMQQNKATDHFAEAFRSCIKKSANFNPKNTDIT